MGESTFADNDRFGGGSRDGESGELGEGDVDFEVTRRNLEGERDSAFEGDLDKECRSCLKAEVGSTWWMWVGDGRCSVPPMSPEGEYDPTMVAPGLQGSDGHGRLRFQIQTGRLGQAIPVVTNGGGCCPRLVCKCWRLVRRCVAFHLFIAESVHKTKARSADSSRNVLECAERNAPM